MLLAISGYITSLEGHPLFLQAVSAILALFIGFITGRLAGRLLKTILQGVGLDQHVRAASGYSFSLERNLSSLLSLIIYVASVIIALNYLGVTSLVLLAIGAMAAIIILISLLLALKDFLPNLAGTFIIKTKKPFTKGNTIVIRGAEGKVERILLTKTKMRAGEDLLLIPNRLFLKEDYKVRKK